MSSAVDRGAPKLLPPQVLSRPPVEELAVLTDAHEWRRLSGSGEPTSHFERAQMKAG